MRVTILHDHVPPDAPPDQADTIVQADVVDHALRQLGHHVDRLDATTDLDRLAAELARRAPDVVFNLVESLGGLGRLIHLAPALVESLGIPITGSPASALALTSSKLDAKRHMRSVGLPTPDWFHPREPDRSPRIVGRWIIKSVWEHASIGLDDLAVQHHDSADALARAIDLRSGALAGEAFAERYVHGREFNLSILELDGEPRVLPHAEIDFQGFGDRPRIVGYDAKWNAQSRDYHATPRRFDFAAADRPLLDRLADLARRCWTAFGLRGWARVDFRVDDSPWILEINANPCLAPDAGFAAAAERASLDPCRVIDAILTAAVALPAHR